MLSNLEIIRLKKILLTAKLDLAFGSVLFWQSSEFFFIQLLPNRTARSPITYNNNNYYNNYGNNYENKDNDNVHLFRLKMRIKNELSTGLKYL